MIVLDLVEKMVALGAVFGLSIFFRLFVGHVRRRNWTVLVLQMLCFALLAQPATWVWLLDGRTGLLSPLEQYFKQSGYQAVVQHRVFLAA